jgi:hypothetical protein
MHGNVLRVISYLFLNHLVCQNLPLSFVFLDVWGPAPTSIEKNKNYVSFSSKA